MLDQRIRDRLDHPTVPPDQAARAHPHRTLRPIAEQAQDLWPVAGDAERGLAPEQLALSGGPTHERDNGGERAIVVEKGAATAVVADLGRTRHVNLTASR